MTNDAAPAAQACESALRPVLWIGDWQIAPSLHRLTRGNQLVRIEPKAMAVLLQLASRPQEVVSREELMAAVWPGVVVGDNALTQVVIKLRRALGDTAREPAYVEAVTKRGYRLIAAVRRVDESAPEQSAIRSPAPANHGAKARWAAGSLAALVLLGGVTWIVQSDLTPSDPQPRMADADGQAPAPTVLVESFEVLGARPDQSLLARAITADLVTDLSTVSGIWVVSRLHPAAGRAATSLPRPRYVLSGTVQQEGDRLRVTVLLTDTASGRSLWSERLDQPVHALFELQDSLVARVLKVLPVKVSEAETLRLARRSTRDLQAYQAFTRAQAALLVRSPDQNASARAHYWEAIRHDPAFARAYAGLALSYALEYQQGWTAEGKRSLARALEFAQVAQRLRPDMPEAGWVLAFVDAQRRRPEDALKKLDEALRLNPSYADAYALKGGILTYLGRPAQSVVQLQQALRLNPDAGSLYFLLLGRAYYFLGDLEQAQLNLDHSLERNPESLEARIYLAATLWQAGDHDAAQWQLNEIRSLAPKFASNAWLAGYPLTAAAPRQQLQAVMVAMGL